MDVNGASGGDEMSIERFQHYPRKHAPTGGYSGLQNLQTKPKTVSPKSS